MWSPGRPVDAGSFCANALPGLTFLALLQVLTKALEVWGLSIIHLDSPEAAAMGDGDQEGFLCNLQQHWFTIRRVGSEW